MKEQHNPMVAVHVLLAMTFSYDGTSRMLGLAGKLIRKPVGGVKGYVTDTETRGSVSFAVARDNQFSTTIRLGTGLNTLHWRLCTLGQVAYCAEPLYRYLVHPYAFDRDPFLVSYGVYDCLRSFLEDCGDNPEMKRIIYRALRDHRASVAQNWIVRALVSSHRDPLRIVSSLSLLAMAFPLSPQTFLKTPFSPRVWQKLAEHEAKSRA